MIQRLGVLILYFGRTLVFSLSGLLYAIGALAYWAIFFPPGQRTPDAENYILVIGVFGAALAFLVTLSIASRANRADNATLVVRLPSRVEYVTAVFMTAQLITIFLQVVVALLALIRGPEFTLGRVLEIPPLWIAINILAGVLALHATDLVTSGWSRVIVYGSLALLLLAEAFYTNLVTGLSGFFANLSRSFYTQNYGELGNTASQAATWLREDGVGVVGQVLNAIFWPFQAMVDGVLQGAFSPTQALAPALIMLYATILYLIAADLFATKDLELVE